MMKETAKALLSHNSSVKPSKHPSLNIARKQQDTAEGEEKSKE